MGLTMAQWDELDEHDRAWALGPDLLDAERDAAKCAACGGPSSDCQDPDNQHAYVVTLRRCFRTRAVQDALKARRNDPDAGSLLVSVTLDPTRKKSATKRGASRG
jgi:hypothetical protein